jgi:hypothetical protein
MRFLLERKGGNGAAVGGPRLSYRTTIPYRFLHAESRLSGGGSISLVSRKNVAKKITER